MSVVVVVAGGPEPPPTVPLPPGATVIAADGGVELARALGLRVELAVGDFDSVAEEPLAAIERVERHAVEKDATDLELALAAALELGPERIVVLAGAGGRLDHLFGGLLLLAADAYAGVRVDAQVGDAAVHVVRGERTLHGRSGELISLLAAHGPAVGVVTEGLVYPLRGETLEPGSTRGVSNVFDLPDVSVSLERGVLLAVRPSGSATAGSGW